MRFQMAGKSLRKRMLAQAQQDKQSDLDQGGPRPAARVRPLDLSGLHLALC